MITTQEWSKLTFLPKRKKKSSAPCYLYQKRNMYYFRYRLPVQFKDRFQQTEIRILLKTVFLRDAKKLARQLYTYLEGILMQDDNEKSWAEIKAGLTVKLEALMESCLEKKALSLTDIKGRMDLALQFMLNSADKAMYSPPMGILFDEDGQPKSVTPSESLDHYLHVFHKPSINNKERLTLSNFPEIILELLKYKYFALEELTSVSIPLILNEYHKLQINFNRIMCAREKGDYAYERQFQSSKLNLFVNMQDCVPFSSQEIKSPELIEKDIEIKVDDKQIKISELIKKYIETKVKDKHWKVHGVAVHRNRLETILDILGDVCIKDITRNHMRDFRDTLCKLPPNRKQQKQYKDKNIEQILAMTPDKVFNIKTVNITVEAIASMLDWAIRENLFSGNNPAKGLGLNDDRQEIHLKDALSLEDIKNLFFSGKYPKKAFNHPSHYWAPLIGLYSGMRLEEICQLHCVDIIRVEDIWCFDINLNLSANGEQVKLLKTKNAARIIPIHDRLIALGLLQYIENMRKSNNERIFPELNKTEKTTKFGKQVGKNFSDRVKKCGIQGNKSFHSLRHSFCDYFKKHNLNETNIFSQVFGHTSKMLAVRSYGSALEPKQCYYEIIAKLNYYEGQEDE